MYRVKKINPTTGQVTLECPAKDDEFDITIPAEHFTKDSKKTYIQQQMDSRVIPEILNVFADELPAAAPELKRVIPIQKIIIMLETLLIFFMLFKHRGF